MLPVMTTALSGALAYQATLDEVAHNLANLSTPAFRPTRLALAEAAEGGVIPTARRLSARPGPLAETGAPFDMALPGPGFFRVRLPDGNYAYTRRGDFRVDGTGRLVTHGGLPLDPEIRIPPDRRVEVRPDGTVVTFGPDGAEAVLGRLEVFTFDRPENLIPLGGGLFREPAGETGLTGLAGPAQPQAVVTGYLEMSAVDLTGEFARLIQAQRAYVLNLNVIRDQDRLLGEAIELARG